MDFAIGLVNFVLYLPNWQVKFFEEFKLQKCEINCAHQKVSGASWNDIWVSKCQFQLAQMARCKTNSLYTLILVMFLAANRINTSNQLCRVLLGSEWQDFTLQKKTSMEDRMLLLIRTLNAVQQQSNYFFFLDIISNWSFCLAGNSDRHMMMIRDTDAAYGWKWTYC